MWCSEKLIWKWLSTVWKEIFFLLPFSEEFKIKDGRLVDDYIVLSQQYCLSFAFTAVSGHLYCLPSLTATERWRRLTNQWIYSHLSQKKSFSWFINENTKILLLKFLAFVAERERGWWVSQLEAHFLSQYMKSNSQQWKFFFKEFPKMSE